MAAGRVTVQRHEWRDQIHYVDESPQVHESGALIINHADGSGTVYAPGAWTSMDLELIGDKT